MQYLAQEPNSYKAIATCISKCLASTVFSAGATFVSLNHIKMPCRFVSIPNPWTPAVQLSLSRPSLFSYREVVIDGGMGKWPICLHKIKFQDAVSNSHLLFRKVSNIRRQLSWHNIRCVRKPNTPITHWGATEFPNFFSQRTRWLSVTGPLTETSRCYGNWHELAIFTLQ